MKAAPPEIIGRLSEYVGKKKKKDIAELLGVTPSDYNNRLKRGTILNLVVQWAIDENVDLNWLIRGDSTDGTDFAQKKIDCLETENRKLTEVLEITSKAKDTLSLILKEVHGADEDQVSKILTRIYEKMKPLDIAGFKMINDLQNRVELLENQLREIWRILEKHQPKDGIEKRQSWKEFKRVVEPLIKEMEEVQG